MKSNGKVAIVTGGGSGIGKHSALALLRDGYSVTIAGRREDALKMVIEEAGEHGSRVLPVPTNVGDPSQVKALFLRTGDRFGRLDVLFNNAGVGAPGVPMECGRHKFDRHFFMYTRSHEDYEESRSHGW